MLFGRCFLYNDSRFSFISSHGISYINADGKFLFCIFMLFYFATICRYLVVPEKFNFKN